MKKISQALRHSARPSALAGWLTSRLFQREPAASAPASRRRFGLEACEPRLLLSADSVLGAGATAAIVQSIEDYGDLLQEHFDDATTDYATRVPGILLTQRDSDGDGEIDDQDVTVPRFVDLLAVEVEQYATANTPNPDNTGATPNAIHDALVATPPYGFDVFKNIEHALGVLDRNDDSVVDWREAYRGVVVGAVHDLLLDYADQDVVDDDVIDAADVEQWVYDGLATRFALLTYPGSELLAGFLTVDLGGVSVGGDSDFDLGFSVSIVFRDTYQVDLGLAADAEEVGFAAFDLTYTSADLYGIDFPDVLASEQSVFVPITGAVGGGVAVAYSGGTAGFAPTDSVVATLAADGDGSASLAGTLVNVGFLGTHATAGSAFELSMRIDTRIVDPSSPERLGFEDADGDDDAVERRSFEAVSSGGVLLAALPPDAAYGLATPIEFALDYAYATGESGAVPFSIDVSAADTLAEIVAALQGAIDASSLAGLISVSDAGGKLRIDLAGSDATALGFSDGGKSDSTSPYVLAASGGFDFDSDNDGDIDGDDAEVVFGAAGFLFSVGGALPRMVSVAGGSYSKSEWKSVVEAALADAGIAGVSVALDETSVNSVKLRFESASTLEIVDTDSASLTMSAAEVITGAELADLEAAGQTARLYSTTPDTGADDFAIVLKLAVNDGLDFTPTGNPEFRVDAAFSVDHDDDPMTADLVYDGPFDLDPAANPSLLAEQDGIVRFNLPTQNSDFDQYLDFNVFGRAEGVAMLEQLEGWAQRLEDNIALAGLDIPMVQSVLGDVLDFSDLVRDSFFGDDQDDDDAGNDVGKLYQAVSAINGSTPVPIFFTVQELGEALDLIGVLETTPSGDYAAYEVDGKNVLFKLGVEHVVADVELPADFSLPLPPLGGVYSESSVYLNATGRFDAFLGIRMGEAGAIDEGTLLEGLNNNLGVDVEPGIALTGAAAVGQVFGRLTANANFSVVVDGTTYVVQLDADDTQDNTSLAGNTPAALLQDLRGALAAATQPDGDALTPDPVVDLNGFLEVELVGNRIALTARPGVSSFSLAVSSSDPAYGQLGLYSVAGRTVSTQSPSVLAPAAGDGGKFTISVNNGGGVELLLATDPDDAFSDIAGNQSATDLVNDLNQRIAASGLAGLIQATRQGDRILFAAVDASVHSFDVAVDASAAAFFGESGAFTLEARLTVLAAAAPDPLADYGRLANDATLTINGVAVSVAQSATDQYVDAGHPANGSLQDLADDLNDAIAASALGAGQVEAVVIGGRLALVAIDPTLTVITVETSAGNPANTGMGFGESQSAGALGMVAYRNAPAYYGPTGETSFRVAIVGGDADTGGTPVSVTLDYPGILPDDDSGGPVALLANASIYDLANDIQRALDDAFGGAAGNPLRVGVDAGRLLFTLKAGTPAGLGATGFSILADDSDPFEARAIDELKLYSPELASPPASVNYAANELDLLIRDTGGTTFGVSLVGATDVSDVLEAINLAAAGAGSGVVASIGPLGNGLQLSDTTPTPGGALAVRTINGSDAALDLGLYVGGLDSVVQTNASAGDAVTSDPALIVGDTIGTLAMIDRVFLRQVDDSTPLISATIEVTSDDPDTVETETIDIEANFGFVAVTASGGGTLAGSLGIGINQTADSEDDPYYDGRLTLRELFTAVSSDRDGDGRVGVEDFEQVLTRPEFDLAGDFTLDVEIVPGGGVETLIDDLTVGSLTVHVADTGNPFNPDTLDVDGNPATPYAPILPDVSVEWTAGDLGDLEPFRNIDFADVLAALKQLADFLDQYAAFDFLNQDIPLIGVNFNDLVDLADRFRAAVTEIEQNPAASVQLLEQKIREEFGLPPGVLTLALDDDDDADSVADDILKIAFDLGASFSESLPVALAIPDGLIDGAPIDISLEGQANLNATGALDAVFVIGVDLNTPLGDAAPVFLYADETEITGSLGASANDLSFNAALGPVGVTIADGYADIALALSFTSGASGRVALGTAFDSFDVSFSGMAEAVLPVYFPTQSNYVGDISLEAAFAANASNDLEITTFDVQVPTEFDIDFSSFSLFDNLGLLIDATDVFLSGVQDALDGEILGFDLPLVGNQLAEGAQFIQDFRAGFIKDLRNLVENAPSLAAETVQGFLYDLLNTQFGILADTDGSGVVDLDDVIIEGLDTLSSPSFSDDYLQWNVLLGDSVPLADINLPFDLGFPALGLNGDVDMNVAIGWELGIGLGISIADGAYIDVRRQDYADDDLLGPDPDDVLPELLLTFDVTLGETANISGDLLFLQLDIAEAPQDLDGDAVADPTHFHAEFSVDLMKGEDASVERLGFSELGSLGFDLALDADAAVNLDLTLKFNDDLVGDTPLSAVLPEIQAHFALLWETSFLDGESGEIGLSDGLEYVAFENVRLDLGKFLGDTIGPLVEQIQSATEPFQPIIDVVTAAIPVLSDLAGEPVTLVDIAAAFGEFNPDLIYAVSDLITLINSIPAEPGSLALPLGHFVLVDKRDGENFSFGGSDFDLTDPNFNFDSLDQTAFSDAITGMGDALGGLGGVFDQGISGFLDGADPSSTQETAKTLFGGGFDTEGSDGKTYGFAFPIFEDPAQIFGLLLGRQATIVTYDLPPFSMDFSWKQSFPIYGPLWGVVTAGVGMKIDLAFGYDTQGLFDFYDSGFTNPLALFSGLYIADTDIPAGGGTDVPELVFTGTVGVGAELNAGIASAGATVNIILESNFDLYDPNQDDKVRINELLSTFLYEVRTGNPALAPISIFDISAEFSLQLKAYIEFLFARFDFEITPPITLFEFSIPFDREPFLATERSDGSLLLNIGSNADARINGDIRDLGEHICVEYLGNGTAKVWSEQLGVPEGGAQIYDVDPNVGIFAYGGEGNDLIVVKGVIKLTAEGGSGDDTLILDGGMSADLKGGVGNDTLVGGAGADRIQGEAGDDIIDGREGEDWLFGDFAQISNGAAGSLRVAVSDEDGNDVIWGGAGEDVVFGGGGNDAIAGDAGAITGFSVSAISECGVSVDFGAGAVEDGNADFLFGDAGRIDADPSSGDAELILNLARTTVELRSVFAGVSLTDREGGGNDLIEGQGGDDVVFAGSGDDRVDGGTNNDTIYGETGLDVLSGGANDDEISGGLGKDFIFGYGEGPGDAYNDGGSTETDGDDLLFGDDGNDLVRGNGGDDEIYGGRGADVLFGDAGADFIYGENEGDTIFGGAGNDSVEGGTGNDTVFGDDGLAIYFKGVEDDYSDDRVIGDALFFNGSDVSLFAYYDDGADTPTGDDDNELSLDLLTTYVRAGSDGDDTVIGGEGDDIVFGGAGDDTVYGDLDPAQWLAAYASVTPPPVPAGQDTLIGDGGRIEWWGRRIDRIESFKGATAADAGDDTLTGNGGADRLLGGGGSDTIHGRLSAAYADGADAGKLDEDVGVDPGKEVSDDDIGIGDDGEIDYARNTTRLARIASTIYDPLAGETYVDHLYGNWGRDILIGGLGGDFVYGDTGLDLSEPRGTDDIMLGDNGELLYADNAIPDNFGRLTLIRTTDVSEITGGADQLFGSEGNDIGLGGVNDGGVDVVSGDNGSDVLLGDNGEVNFAFDGDTDLGTLDLIRSYRDSLGGTDVVSGMQGDDVLIGGTGGDFMYGDDSAASHGAADGEDIMLGDNADVFLIGTVGRLTVRVGDMAVGTAVDLITTTDTVETTGGADVMSGNAGNDIVLGGVNDGGVDTLYGDRAAPTPASIAFDADDILLGDNGLLDFTYLSDTDRNTLDLIRSFEDGSGGVDVVSGDRGLDVAIGGTAGDTIYGDDANASAGAMDLGDLLLGDNADVFLVDALGASGGDAKLVLGAAVKTIRTTDEEHPEYGGADTISGNAGGDLVAGGVFGDTLYGDRLLEDATATDDGDDVILGDNGAFEWLSSGRLNEIHGIAIASENPALWAKFGTAMADTDLTTLDLVTTEQPNSGGRDFIRGDNGGDLIFGGTDADTIYGDDGDLEADATGGDDLLLGDHGRIYPHYSALADFNSRNFFAIDTGDADGGEGDRIWGEEGDDTLMGQQGDDLMWGGGGDDDMTGGHNVSGGYDELGAPAINITLNPAVNDLMDGGLGDDAMAGDNAIIWRRGDDLSPRFRELTEASIYTTTADTITANVETFASRYLGRSDPADAVGRDITPLDHDDAVEADPQGRYGNDVMAGGGDADTMFGQLGDDLMQGDGEIATLMVVAPFIARTLGVDDSGGNPDTDQTLYFNVPERASDGDDYLEGNGGSDLMYGGLGQDDMIGGSSALYGLETEFMRPDTTDFLYGGAGIAIARNDTGATSFGLASEDPDTHAITTGADGHARDADFIMGDNANVYRLVDAASDSFRVFNYDDYGPLKIIPRAMQQLDYTLGGADYNAGVYVDGAAMLDGQPADNGAADLIHGESGDDIIFGMTGSDVIFGEGQDDDIVGGYGHDWVSGGTGRDGVLGDDGLIYTSRNSTTGEALYGVAGLLDHDPEPKYANGNVLDEVIKTPGEIQYAVINVTGELKKTADLVPFSMDPAWNALDDEFPDNQDDSPFADDVIFGGLGSDWLHGGSGDDAISGAEALEHAYVPTFDAMGNANGVLDLGYDAVGLPAVQNPGDTLAFNPEDSDGQHLNNRYRAGEFALYDEYDPRRKILLDDNGELWKSVAQGQAFEFLLNFDETEGVVRPAGTVPKATGQQTESYPQVNDDGADRIFGDNGNDWIVGGTGRDDIYGGWGNDLLNADDNHDTHGELNDQPDTHPTYEDRAYGGAGRDVLIGNTGGDRLIDWVGEYNSYLVPYAPFGQASVSRTLQPFLPEFLYALSAGDGADPTRPGDTGADPARNGEPDGELGLVLQMDFAWQDQTGAPADPQAGNIPGGARDVLRTANFNDGTAQGFVAESGQWTLKSGVVSVAPTVLGSDAVTLWYHDQALPSYFEITATINPVKPIAGYKANAYIVFDYYSDTDFKFAGLNSSTNKIEIGQRTASGWQVLASSNMTIKAGTNYNVLVALNGSTATIQVNNGASLSYGFAPRVDQYGVTHNFNDGMVGLGADNAKASIDNVNLRVLPPAIVLTRTDGYSSGTPALTVADTGAWNISGGRYIGAPGVGQPIALASGALDVGSSYVLQLEARLLASATGGVVFDYYDADDFKWAAVDKASGKVLLGHYTERAGWVVDASVAKTLGTKDVTLAVTLKGSTVSVLLNGSAALSNVYNALVTDGGYGLVAKGGQASFDSFTVRTDDPDFAGEPGGVLTLETATPADGADGAAPLALADAERLAREAIRRWSLAADPALVAAMQAADIGIADLPGQTLGEYRDGTIFVDVDAAGHGWFVDQTAWEDREFGADGVAAHGPAAGRIDLLSALAHELGHAAGYGHSDAGVMADRLATGTRVQPAPNNAAPPPFAGIPGFAMSFEAPRGEPAGDAGEDDVPVIAWNVSPPLSVGRANQAAWAHDFANHLGKNEAERNPNASLRLHLDTVNDTTPEVAML